ncbi:MAG: YfiR family protein [Akkermansiaceae bacterium]|nr:YfiR family protein [Verrucomicrobiales bacterium]
MLLLLLALVGMNPGFATAQTQTSREYQLKAVFLFNFAQFTHWPTNAFTNGESPIVIGVLGIDPFGDVLEETVRDETVNGRKLVIERYRRLEEIQSCHILFISQSETRRLDRILESLRGKPVLTVGDIDPAFGQHLAIRFLPENNRLRIRINIDSVSDAGLTISSKLLRAAEIIPPGKAP